MSSELSPEQSEEIKQIFSNAKEAADAFSSFSSDKVRVIWEAIGKAATEKAAFYAEWAVRDTGYGNVEDKTQKKLWAGPLQLQAWNPADFIDPVIDEEKKLISFPKPAGVVVTLVPVTNPVFGVIGMIMQMVMTRNVLILCPHPGAQGHRGGGADLGTARPRRRQDRRRVRFGAVASATALCQRRVRCGARQADRPRGDHRLPAANYGGAIPRRGRAARDRGGAAHLAASGPAAPIEGSDGVLQHH